MGRPFRFKTGGVFRTIVLIFLILPAFSGSADAQDKIDVQLIVENSLNTSRLISISQLAGSISSNEPFLTLYVSNITPELQNNLYLNINVNTTRFGEVIDIDERRGFSLEPGQTGRANMSNLRNGIPGITNVLSFNPGLTPRGEEMINSLRGSTFLPDDIYTITVQVFQNGNSNSGQLVGSISVVIGVEPALTTYDIRLVQPGEVIGAGSVISTTNPVFNWSGDHSLRYRLIVVEASGNESADALIQAALDTAPPTQGGRLLTGEMADMIVDQQSWAYPPSGVKPLEQSQSYYWQVFAMVPDVSGLQLLPSEIFEFRVSDQVSVHTPELTAEINALVRKYFRRSDILGLNRDGFDLISIDIDGVVYTGPEIIRILEDFFGKVEDGKIRLVE